MVGVVNHYLTDTDAWFLLTDVPNGLKHFKRVAIANSMDGDCPPKQPAESEAIEKQPKEVQKNKPAGSRPERNKKRQSRDQRTNKESRVPRPPREHQKMVDLQPEPQTPAVLEEVVQGIAHTDVMIETEVAAIESTGSSSEQKKSFNGKRRGPRRRPRHSGQRRQGTNEASNDIGTEAPGQDASSYKNDFKQDQSANSPEPSAFKYERKHRPEDESAPAIVENFHYDSGSDS